MSSAKDPSRTTSSQPTSPDRPATASAHPIPPSFAPGPKPSADGKHVFHKDPAREAFDARWSAAVARGEDPYQNLVTKVDNTKPSSFVEYWWRKGRGKKGSKAEERDKVEEREREREEGGARGLLEGEGREEVEDGAGEKKKKKGRGKWHDRLRWGI